MSRCFPFPPPGYEKKPRIEDTIALKEEKKEKKHKKEKKDREKREGKEKKDKDRDDGKDKERRDKKEKHKKEKHRDKKKKDKDKDKDKGSNSETSGAAAANLGTEIDDKLGTTKEGGKETFFGTYEKNGCAVSRRQNGEEYIPISISIPSSNNKNNNNNNNNNNNSNSNINLISQGMEDSSFVQELARRINDEEKVTQHNQFSDKDEDSRFVLQLDRRFKDGDKVTTNHFDRFSAAAAGKRKIDDGEYNLVKCPGDFVADKKGKDRHIGGFRTMDGKGIVNFGEKSMAQSFAGTTPQGEEENPKEKDDKSRKKHKSKDGEKKSRHKKEKDLEKDKKKAKTKKQDKNTTEPLTQKGRRNGLDDVSINASMAYSVDSKVKGSVPPLSDGRRVDETEKRIKVSDTNGPLISCSGGFEVMGNVPLYDQRNNATVEGCENRRKDMDTDELVSSSNASSFTLSGQKNHASVRKNEKKQNVMGTNGPENLTAAKNYSVDVTEVMGSVPLSSDNRNHVIVIGNAKKRNDIGLDSLLHDKEARTNNKIPRLSPPHNSLENGRKLEAHQSLKVLNSDRHDGGSAKSLLQVDNNKEQHHHQQQKNGLIDVKSLHILGPNPSVVLSDQIIERPRKSIPPHPDTEFLSQILTVPKMDEWNGLDDQEWLLHCQDPPLSREPTKTMSLDGVSEDLHVWSEALNIESMDIVAFPYVLPY